MTASVKLFLQDLEYTDSDILSLYCVSYWIMENLSYFVSARMLNIYIFSVVSGQSLHSIITKMNVPYVP